MAQIRIEEKKTRGIIPWIVGLLLLVFLIWGVVEVFDEADEEMYTEEVVEDDTYVAPVSAEIENDAEYLSPVVSFMEYTTEMEGKMGLDHEFSHRALSLLAAATSTLAEARGVEDTADAESKSNRVMRMADEIMQEPYATDHADKIRMSALLITEILEEVDNHSYNSASNVEIENLREEAQAITAETLTLNQKEDIRSFFQQARMVLDRMT